MNQRQSFPSDSSSRAAGTRAAFWPQLARFGWLALALGCLGVVLANVNEVYASYASFSFDNEIDPAMIRTGLALLGFPVWLYVLIRFAAQMLVALCFMAMGAVIFWRRPDDRGATLVSLQLVLFGALLGLPLNFAPPWPWLTLVGELVFVSFFFSCYWFPNGRFVPRWTRWLAIVWIASVVGGTFFPGTWLDVDAWPPLLNIAFLLALSGSCVGAQVYRYRRVASALERQQIKWLIAGFAAVISGFILYNQVLLLIPELTRPGRAAALYDLIGGTTVLLSFVLIPMSLGYAMLRHRLYDVDIVINRALVYGALSITLALVYGGSILVAQQAVRALTGQSSDLAVVASTLLIAALAQPLRWRLQQAIDRRFFRQKYDAAATLSAFSARLRDGVELHSLTDDVVALVHNTLQPAHVSLWLRDTRHEVQR